MNDARYIWPLLHHMLMAMVCLEMDNGSGRSQYCKSMFINLLLLHHHKGMDDCVWQMFRQDPGLFNEDVGETVLSSLARDTECQPNKRSDITQVNRAFQRIGLLPTVVSDFEVNFNIKETVWYRTLRPDCAEITITVTFMKALIQAIRSNSGTEYAPQVYQVRSEAHAAAISLTSTIRFTAVNPRSILRGKLAAYEKLQSKPLVEEFPALWGLPIDAENKVDGDHKSDNEPGNAAAVEADVKDMELDEQVHNNGLEGKNEAEAEPPSGRMIRRSKKRKQSDTSNIPIKASRKQAKIVSTTARPLRKRSESPYVPTYLRREHGSSECSTRPRRTARRDYRILAGYSPALESE
jgi:hypothetical protein